MSEGESRRRILSMAAITGLAVAVGGRTAGAAEGEGKERPADVNATEDLMREHGVLRRVLLIYAEAVRRIRAGSPPRPDVVASAAGVIRRFIEGYHERLEEDEVFPRMRKAGKQVDLVQVLIAQHEAGRRLTREILADATPAGLQGKAGGERLVSAMERFIRMYEPHAAREDTVLFPEFHALFTEAEFDKLGDAFEDKEHQVLGAAGFEGTVRQVAQLERALGIYELAQFTPR